MSKINNKPLVIRDPIHGDIKIHEAVCQEIIATPEFQRLRKISQNAGASFAFPGATHTRFAHSIGTYYIANLITHRLKKRTDNFSEHDYLKVKLAGLVHDIGHGPFSHSFEAINVVKPNLFSHEEYSSYLISNPKTNINKILKKHNFSDKDILDIINMIKGQSDHCLAEIVSSQVDADRLDYLARDIYYTGTNYGYTDTQYLVRNMSYNKRLNKITFSYKALFALENYLVGRHHMFLQIYNHHISVGFDILLTSLFKRMNDLYSNKKYQFKNSNFRYLKEIFDLRFISYENYLRLNDYFLTEFICNLEKEEDKILSELAKCFGKRWLFRKVNEKTFDDYDTNFKKIKVYFIQKFGPGADKYFLVTRSHIKTKLYETNSKPILLEEGKNNKITTLTNCSVLISGYLKNFKPQNENKFFYTINEFL